MPDARAAAAVHGANGHGEILTDFARNLKKCIVVFNQTV